MKKRLGVYVLQDKNGEVDDYIEYFINHMVSNLETLVIFCMGKIDKKNIDKLKHFTDIIFESNEIYLELSAYGKALEYFGWDNLNEYEEVILMNDSVFGPFYPFTDCLENMEHEQCDFWGMTRQDMMLDKLGKVQDAYPHGYFLVIRDELIHSKSFIDFWKNYEKEINISECSNEELEIHFARKMVQDGYTWNAYAKAEKYVNTKPGYNIDCSKYAVSFLIKEQKCPVIRCSIFANTEGLEIGFRGDIREAYDYINLYTEYDVNMIWNHILRIYSIVDIKESLHLNYILPLDTYNPLADTLPNKKIAVILHMYYEDLMDVCLEYINNIPNEMDIIVTTNGEKQKNYIDAQLKRMGRKNYYVLFAGKRGRDAGALLVTCKSFLEKYEYLCFVHDKKTTGGTGAYTVGESFMNHMWENLLASKKYINNVIHLFEENERLGLLSPPVPAMGGYLTELVGNEWTCCINETQELAKKLKLRVPIEAEKKPFALSTSFWCRTTALKPLFQYDWQFTDFPPEPLALDGTINHAIERILIYVTQHERYYSGIIQNDKYASLFTNNIFSVMTKLLSDMRDVFEVVSPLHFKDYFQSIFDMNKFCWEHKEIMIFGAGNMATHISKLMGKLGITFECFLVSNADKNPKEKEGHPVKTLNDIIHRKDEVGIIIALNKQNQSEVVPVMKKLGVYFYCLDN